MLLAAALPAKAHAASAYLGDTNGGTSITVTAGDDFQVVLWAVSAVKLAAYDCKIVVDGPATPIDHAAHGYWFSNNHTVFGGFDEGSEDPEDPRPNLTPPNYNTAMLYSPPYITGSGEIVVFTLHADEEGSVAINVDEQYFFFANSDEEYIELTIPSTLYVTIEAGDGLDGGGELDSGGGEMFLGNLWYVNGAQGAGQDAPGRGKSPSTPFATISHAIDEASSGDTILVAGADNDGITYEGNLTIGKTLHLYGARDPGNDWAFDESFVSTIEGDGTQACVKYTTSQVSGHCRMA